MSLGGEGEWMLTSWNHLGDIAVYPDASGEERRIEHWNVCFLTCFHILFHSLAGCRSPETTDGLSVRALLMESCNLL